MIFEREEDEIDPLDAYMMEIDRQVQAEMHQSSLKASSAIISLEDIMNGKEVSYDEKTQA
jgi:uncharacterized protein (UPF0147 family)